MTHFKAVLQALLVTFLWSTSWVLIKLGLDDIPALTFAGLRYSIAFLMLLVYVLRLPGFRQSLAGLTPRDWKILLIFGLLFYTGAQGAQFLALNYLPAATLSLMLNFTGVVVALLGIVALNEKPHPVQWGGMLVFLIGVFVYFYPVDIPSRERLGLLIGVGGMLANAIGAVLGRHLNRGSRLPALIVTLISMGIGSLTLLVLGISAQGLPSLSLTNWGIILWLAAVNTAFAFTLWNHTLRTLSAMESSVINNTMLVQIAVMAWIFLDESLSLRQVIGMLLVTVGIIIVQLGGTAIRTRIKKPLRV